MPHLQYIHFKPPLKPNQQELEGIQQLLFWNSAHALYTHFDVCVGCGHSADTIPHPDWLNSVVKFKVKGHSSSPFQ